MIQQIKFDTALGEEFGGGLFGSAAVLGLFGLGLVLALAVVALDLVMPLWLSVLVIAVIVFAAAGLAALMGRRALAAATPMIPNEAAAGLTADLDTVKAAALRMTGQIDANYRKVFGHKVEDDLHSP